MSETIDALNIQISADASSANSALKQFTGTLNELATAGKPVATVLTRIANAFKSIASGNITEANRKVAETVTKYKELGTAAQTAAKKVKEADDAFKFKGTQAEIDSAAKKIKAAGLEDAAKFIKDIGKDVGQSNLDSVRQDLEGIADALYEAGNPEAAAQIRAAAKSPKELDNVVKDFKADAKEAAKEAKNFGKETEKMAESSQKASGWLGKLLKSLGRIAFYRAIRTAIKNISSSIREGLTNLYAYSQEVGTAFAPAVDNLRQHVLLLKNAFATALRPVLEALIPIIIQFVDWLSKMADYAAQIFSVLFGKTDEQGRYTKAVLGDLQQSNKEAKELQRTLLGFDEINRLNGDNGRGSSDSSGLNFIQADVSDGAKKIASALKKVNWGKILEVAEALGIAFMLGKDLPLWLSGAIGAMAIWGDDIKHWTDEAQKSVDNFFGNIDTKNSQTLLTLKEFAQQGSNLVLDTIGTVSSLIYHLVHGDMEGALEDAVHLAFLALKAIALVVVEVVNLVLGLVNDVYNGILTAAQWVWNKALQPVFNFFAVAIDNIDKAFKAIWLDLKIAVGKLVLFFYEAASDLVDIFVTVVNGIIDTLNALGADIKPVSIDLKPNVQEFRETIEEIEKERVEMQPTEWTAELVPKWSDEKLDELKIDTRIDLSSVFKDIDKLEQQTLTALKNAISRSGITNVVTSAINQSSKNKNFAQYASGGYPSAGSMFIAGETGAGAEWVGDINGRTSVVNSEQMAAAIYGAMSAALANNPQGGDIYLDGEVIYKNTVRRNNNAVRATGRSALLT